MILFFYGENIYNSQKKLLVLKERFLKTDSEGMNLKELEGAELTFSDFVKELETMPFLGGKRLVIVRNLLLENKDHSLLEKILVQLEKVPESVVLVFFEKGVPDKRSKLFKVLKKIAQTEEFFLPEPWQVNKWIEEEVAKRGGKINSLAVDKLAVFVGNNLWQLSNEIDKLIAYAGGKEIKSEDVELLVKAKVDKNIFRLTDAFGKKDRKLALQILHEFIDLGLKPEYLLAMLGGHLRNLIQVKESSQNGLYPVQIQALTKLHPYVVKKCLEQSRAFTLEQLIRIYEELAGLDEKLKLGKVPSRTALELILALV